MSLKLKISPLYLAVALVITAAAFAGWGKLVPVQTAYAAPNNPPSFDPIADQTVTENASSQNVVITNVSPGAGEGG